MKSTAVKSYKDCNIVFFFWYSSESSLKVGEGEGRKRREGWGKREGELAGVVPNPSTNQP